MNRIITRTILVLAAVLASQTIGFGQTATTVPLYRLYGSSHHFYTTSKAERDSAIQNANYKDEGIAGYVFDKLVPGTVALYRFVKETSTGTRHYYAISSVERQAAINDGYKSEGICCYVSKNATDGTVPFLHVYLAPKAKSSGTFFGGAPFESNLGDDHLYTTDEKEKFDAINKYGFVVQTNQGYIWKTSITKSTKLILWKINKN